MTEMMMHDPKRQKAAMKKRELGPESWRRTGLFLRIRDGEPHLFGVVADELGALLRRRLRRNTGTQALCDNPADVDDVLQTTFLRLWEHQGRFDSSRGMIDAWAWIIARNAAVDVLRRRSRTLSLNPADDIEDESTPTPGDGLVEAEQRQVVATALAQVTDPRVRQVLELRLMDGLSYAAVSKVTGVPHGTVATWVHRLRHSLRLEARWAA